MTEKPHETIGRAARQMREYAEAATTTAWAPTKTRDRSLIYYDIWGLDDLGEPDEPIAQDVDRADAVHIAGWHPLVALTVAAWLESWAGLDVAEDRPYSDDWAHALRIARVYLGDDDD
jgi:hypothetical protein